MSTLKRIYSFFKDFLLVVEESKKAKALLVGLMVTLVGKIGFDISDESVYAVLAFLGAYMLGQGQADKGKEAVKLQVAELRKEKAAIMEKIAEAEANPKVTEPLPVIFPPGSDAVN